MMYMLHTAVYFGIVVTAAGFITMHFAAKAKSQHLNIASLILIIGGILGLLCTIYYSFSYWQQGYFTTPMPMHQMNSMMPMQGDAPMSMHKNMPMRQSD